MHSCVYFESVQQKNHSCEASDPSVRLCVLVDADSTVSLGATSYGRAITGNTANTKIIDHHAAARLIELRAHKLVQYFNSH